MVPTDKGFTLIEITIVLLIISLLAFLSVPSFTKLLNQNAAKTTTQKIFHFLHFARLEAIKRNDTVVVCGSLNLESCHNDWSKGLIAFIDNNHNHIFDEKDVLLRANKLGNKKIHIDLGNTTIIKYTGDGHCLTRCSIAITADKQPISSIVLYDSGRARIEHYG